MKGVVGHILEQLHARPLHFRPPGRCQCAVELDEKQPEEAALGLRLNRQPDGIGAGTGLDDFVAQPDASASPTAASRTREALRHQPATGFEKLCGNTP